MRTIQFDTAPVFRPLLGQHRYKGAFGGRGSAKSHFFAEHLVEYAVMEPSITGEGLFAVCLRQVQKSLKQSAKRLVELKLNKYDLGAADGFRVYDDRIACPKDGLIIFEGMQDHNADSIKSLEGAKVSWWEEAQSASQYSIMLLRPTMRRDDSEMWWSWNPQRPTDPVDLMLRGARVPSDAAVIETNWRDNPWFPAALEQERLDMMRNQPHMYDHVWEGGYATVMEGAYYAAGINKAKQQGRIGRYPCDPLHTVRAFWDLGGSSAHSDATAIWIAQFIGAEIRVLSYYEAVGQPATTHIQWMKRHYPEAHCYLPHDAKPKHPVFEASWESALREAGFRVTVVPNQGAGAAAQRIDAGRRWIDSMYFNEAPTKPGLEALGFYHERIDQKRGIGLGPEHDWSSHAADSFGLMALCYDPPKLSVRSGNKNRNAIANHSEGWMA